MKQIGNQAGKWIDPCQVGTFVQIAVNAGQAEIGVVVRSSVLSRADMLDVVGRQRRILLMQAAVFATISRTPAHNDFRTFCHSAAGFMRAASRRSTATNLLART